MSFRAGDLKPVNLHMCDVTREVKLGSSGGGGGNHQTCGHSG